MTTTDRPQLARLAQRIDQGFIRNTRDDGKGEDYAPHHAVNQLLLLILGPFSFKLVQIHRGDVLERIREDPNKGRFLEGKSVVKLHNVVVGATFRLAATVDGERVVIEQTGDVEHADLWQHDGARLKDAESDALKRCAMRLGLGLHLWADRGYILDKWLPVPKTQGNGSAAPADSRTPAPAAPPPQPATTPPQQTPAEPAEAPPASPTADARATSATSPAEEARATITPGGPLEAAQNIEQLATALNRSLTNVMLRLRRAGQLPPNHPQKLPEQPFANIDTIDQLKALAGDDFNLAKAWLLDAAGAPA
ncbi:MAG TPA: hypothetical protein VG276_28165 [Actinomycetes bacterium]|jgi:hypothetical protein|nr:hypothetical protein [Actinomycetes bacterium]